MTTLTEFAYYTRRGVIGLGVGVVVFLIVRWLFIMSLGFLFPPPPPAPPDLAFKKLPALVFETTNRGLKLSYSLQLKESAFPTVPDRMTVYFIPQELPNLLAKEKAKQMAEYLGFRGEPVDDAAYRYQFIDTSKPRTLVVDMKKRTMRMLYDYVADSSVILSPSSLDINNAIQQTKEMFQRLGLWVDEINSNTIKTQFYNFEDNKLLITNNPPDYKVLRLDFFKKDLDKYPVVTPKFITSPIYAYYTGKYAINQAFIDINFTSFSPNMDTKGTYPIKTPEQAWNEVQKGLGFVVSQGNNTNVVVIRKVYLAYYDTAEYQPYLQPIYVFEGDNNFALYIPAIIDAYTGTAVGKDTK